MENPAVFSRVRLMEGPTYQTREAVLVAAVPRIRWR